MPRSQSIAIVGPGRLGSALARALNNAKYEVRELIIRDRSRSSRDSRKLAKELGAKISKGEAATLDADVVWICVPDSVIRSVANELAKGRDWKGKIALHCSAALSSSELEPLRTRGANVASAHPMMSFVHRTKVDLRGVALAIEGDRAAIKFAEQVAGRLGMLSFRIPRESKVLYHVLGSFSSPLLIALLRTAEEVAQAAGIRREQARKIIGPILEQTTRNYRETGAERAFTGPIARGDVKTVAKHLQALKRVPTAEPIYRALASLAAEKLPAAERGGFRKLLRTLASGKEMA